MKNLVVPKKTTFERFAKVKGVKVFGKPRVHYCDGSLRGPAFKHAPIKMHLSGTAASGNHRLIRYECPLCGIKRTYGQSG